MDTARLLRLLAKHRTAAEFRHENPRISTASRDPVRSIAIPCYNAAPFAQLAEQMTLNQAETVENTKGCQLYQSSAALSAAGYIESLPARISIAPDLAKIISSWPDLSVVTRITILGLIDGEISPSAESQP